MELFGEDRSELQLVLNRNTFRGKLNEKFGKKCNFGEYDRNSEVDRICRAVRKQIGFQVCGLYGGAQSCMNSVGFPIEYRVAL